jgi:dihydrofolate reductase
VSELIADLFISLDGFAAGEDVGPFFGYGGPELDEWIHEHLDEPQEIVFGRRTFEVLASISASSSDDPGSRRMTEMPKLVVSNTLSEPLAWANTRLVRGDVLEILAEAKRESPVALRTMGSLSLVASLLRAGLVDRLRLSVFPVVLGSRGREPFSVDWGTQQFLLVSTQVLDGRVVVLEYRTAG